MGFAFSSFVLTLDFNLIATPRCEFHLLFSTVGYPRNFINNRVVIICCVIFPQIYICLPGLTAGGCLLLCRAQNYAGGPQVGSTAIPYQRQHTHGGSGLCVWGTLQEGAVSFRTFFNLSISFCLTASSICIFNGLCSCSSAFMLSLRASRKTLLP